MKKQQQTPATLLRYCVGIDVGKDTLHLCISAIDADGRVSVKGSSKFSNLTSSFENMEAWCDKHCKNIDLPVRYLMESTGVYHEQVAWYLFRTDKLVSVVLPNKAKHYLRSLGHKSKNDRSGGRKIDARGLAQMGLEQNLPLWQPLSKEIYTLRMLTRQHQRLQELKNQSQNQQHSIENSQTSDPFIIRQLDKLIKLYDQQIEQIDAQIRKLLAREPVLGARIEQLCKVKGLGLLSVATIVAETNGFTGFDNVRHLVSFAGYDVVENQSGQRVGKTKISKKGNSRIRRMLFLPAFNAVRYGEPSCQALFERVYGRTRIKMKGYVAVQKKLLTLCYALWRNDTEYDPMYYTNNVKEQESNETQYVYKKVVPTSGTTQDVAA